MNSKKQLIDYLINNESLRTDSIINSFKTIDRIDFVLKELSYKAYQDIPLPIWYWQTISQPSTVAFMLELLSPNKWDNILDIWTWSWWTTALLSYIVWETWYIKWYEIIPELVNFWINNLEKYNLKNCTISQSKDSFSFIDWKYDKILVSASADYIPKDLINKLKVWWTMVIPIVDYIYNIKKLNEKWDVHIDKYYGFRFVPLITN